MWWWEFLEICFKFGGAGNVKKQDYPLIWGWGRRYEFNVKEKNYKSPGRRGEKTG